MIRQRSKMLFRLGLAGLLFSLAATDSMSKWGFETEPLSAKLKSGKIEYSFDGEKLYKEMVTAFISREGRNAPGHAEFYHDDNVILPGQALSYIERDTMEFTYDMNESTLVLMASISLDKKKEGKLFAHTWSISRQALIAEMFEVYESYPEEITRYPLLMEIMREYFIPVSRGLPYFFQKFRVSHDEKTVRLTGKLKMEPGRIQSVREGMMPADVTIMVTVSGANPYKKEIKSESENFLVNCGFTLGADGQHYVILLTFDNPFMQTLPMTMPANGVSSRVKGTYTLMFKGKQVYSGFVSQPAFHISKTGAEAMASVNTAKRATRECVMHIIRDNYILK